ncbi:LPKTxAVK-anchored surface protein [Streptococcus panodentis]|uniref:Uncharacterized protein n=1 Tax=Streptococcus panodentis TaxID=1581472 RepID=A0ABS5AWJ2_9STRE|nr:hypothetical protein [Streptococcus panodentis]MBP2620950.1 hypothetical protein [Streptococcus panodentis]
MKKVLLSNIVVLLLFGTVVPISAEEGSMYVPNIEKNEIVQGTTDEEARKVMDALLEYKAAQSALDQQVAEARRAPIGQNTVMEDRDGNKVLVIGEGATASTTPAPQQSDEHNAAAAPSVDNAGSAANQNTDTAPPKAAGGSTNTKTVDVPAKKAGTVPSRAAKAVKSADKKKSSQASAKEEKTADSEENDEGDNTLPKTSAVK